MRVSVVTPFYEGGKYIDNYIGMMVENAKVLPKGAELTVVMVNDSPWEPIDEADIFAKARDYINRYNLRDLVNGNLQIRVINNPSNQGIHQSRVTGLLSEPCDYVMFLDQDDRIAQDAIAEFISLARMEPEVIVANAQLEQAQGDLILYRSKYHLSRVGNLGTYLDVGTMIVSPGQTIIYADAIPDSWKTCICHKNGADDYFLWLLLLEQGIPFRAVDEVLYTHVYTQVNLSADTCVTDESSYEFIEFMKRDRLLEPKHIDRLETMLRYKADFRAAGKLGKIGLSLKHFKIFCSNLIFKIRSKTPYGFNRG